MSMRKPAAKAVLGRGIVSGVAGTVVMTAFQKLVEMPLTQRGESFAPATSPRRSRRSTPTCARVDGV
jgi:hypothetical protein